MNAGMGVLLVLLGLYGSGSSLAQSGPPPLPPLPPMPAGRLLDVWEFSGTNFLSLRDAAPISLTNVTLVPTWAGNGLQVDSTNASWINYAVVEPSGRTNLDVAQGTIEMWISPDWNSSDGLAAWGVILEAGNWDTNLASAIGAWGLFISPDASNLYFSAQTNGVITNYLSAPINWTAGDWHHIALTYSATSSALYLEGQLVANGPGVTVIPGAEVLASGFSIGSDGNGSGMLQSRSVFNGIATYNYPLDALTISNNYAEESQNVYPLPSSGTFAADSGPPSLPGGFGSGTNAPDGGGSGYTPTTYPSGSFWLQVLPPGINAYNSDPNSVTLILNGTMAGIAYQLLSTTNLNHPVWTVEQNLIGSEVTNFTVTTVSMAGRPTLFFKAMAYTLDSDGDGLPDWWETKYSTSSHPLDPNNADTGSTGIPDGYKQDSAGDGYNNLQKYYMNIPPGTWVTPPTPTGFNAVLNTDGTSATLSWNPSPGPVMEYIIQRADPTDGILGDLSSFATIATINAANTSYTDNSGTLSVGDLLSTFGQGSVYRAEAVYGGGNSAFAGLPMLGDVISPSCAVNAKLVRGGDGRYQLAFSAVPTGVQNILIKWVLYDYWQDTWDGATATNTIAVSNLVNSCYVIPDEEITNYFPWACDIFDPFDFYHPAGWDAWVQGIGANGQVGPFIEAGFVSYDAPYAMDCRQHLKDSLNFLLESATLTQLYPPLADAFPPGWLPLTNNFVEVGLYHPLLTTKNSYADTPFVGLDNTWPLMLDYTLAQWLYSTNTLPSFVWGQYGEPSLPAPSWPYYLTTPADVLLPNGTYQTGPYGIQHDMGNLADVGASVSTNGMTVSLASGIHNIFGLAVKPALPNGGPDPSKGTYDDPTTGLPDSWPEQPPLAPGATITFTYGPLSSYYSQFQAPHFQTLSYYFAPVNFQGPGVVGLNSPVQRYPLPLTSDFALTNTTPFVIASVGQPMVIGGWAKQVLTNGASGVYAYLGQYFETNAYKIGTNGIMTTNITGIMSPYGEFLPTEPGPTALKTMPDLTTGQQGTDIVNVIKMQLDVNHDGIMDLTFAGPDNTSADRPYKFWINNDCDAAGAPATGPDRDLNLPKNPDFSGGWIKSQRDLEDYARLWICGMPAIWSSNGYQVTLSWSNIVGGNPSIELFNSIETNGGIGYLTNTTTAAAQVNVVNYSGVSFGTVTNGTTFTFPANYFTNGAIKYLLFEGAGVGQGELVLTISQNGTNIIASTSVFMNLMDVKNMFEHALITGVTNVLPGNTFSPSTYVEGNPLPSDPTEDTNLVLLVHGWRMGVWEYNNFSETMFKRLYWQGYHGRFMSLRWPTLSADDFWLPAVDYTTYNSSEFIAWRSGSGVSAYLTHLKQRFPNYSLNVCSHSMGGVVMAEALRLQLAAGQRNVNNYVLMQAAVPASCYDSSFTNYAPFITAEESEPTPNTYRGYPGTISGAITGQMVDFYNTNDYALATGTLNLLGLSVAINWEANQENFKPNTSLNYRVDGTGTNCANGFVSITDSREIMAFCARPRAKAVGAQPGVGGVIHGTGVDLTAGFGFGRNSDEHSAQFNWNIQQVNGFYHTLLNSLIPPE